jgi:glutamate synthase (NADPH) small chain
MGEMQGFLKYPRQDIGHRPVKERVQDYREMDLALTPDQLQTQAARCMDCGIPFCHGNPTGCPVENKIPDFNELVYRGHWQEACHLLHSTNNFPEITGRVCPAPCEAACTLNVNDNPVMIKHIEYQIVERGFQEGWIQPQIATQKTGKRVAVIGSGPAGLATAQNVIRAGHEVVVIEKDENPGGMLSYGIPDFKLEKTVIDRRIDQMVAEGVEFQTGVTAGIDISAHYLRKHFDCICLTMGAGQPRDLEVPGRELGNVMFAMDYLTMQNRLCSGETTEDQQTVSARDKVVAVIGGGDTGSDCVGTARRQGAKQIHQFEILPLPPVNRPGDTPWPLWPRIMRTSTSQQEGCERRWSVMTKQLTGQSTVNTLQGVEVEWTQGKKGWDVNEKKGTDFTLEVDLVLLAMGFVHVTHSGLVDSLGLALDDRGNIQVNHYQTSQPWVFAAGDAVSGASLVVRAIQSGKQAAAAIDRYLTL